MLELDTSRQRGDIPRNKEEEIKSKELGRHENGLKVHIWEGEGNPVEGIQTGLTAMVRRKMEWKKGI